MKKAGRIGGGHDPVGRSRRRSRAPGFDCRLCPVLMADDGIEMFGWFVSDRFLTDKNNGIP